MSAPLLVCQLEGIYRVIERSNLTGSDQAHSIQHLIVQTQTQWIQSSSFKALIEVRVQIRTTSVFQGCGNIWHNNFGFLIVVHGFQNRRGFAVLWLHFARKLDSLQQFFNLFLGTLYKNCRLILFMSPLMMT